MSQKEREELRQLWVGLVAAFRASGLGQAQWCRQNGYKVRHLHYWLRKFPATDATASETAAWLSVPIVPERNVGATLVVRVGSTVIDVRPGFDPDLLRAVVRALA
ncbi:IS66 family insertion sequence element accessory protein TnpA [Sulfobacillus harzensis]|uniref:IS66 family insertion sequence element accessory protein TnpB n=1 Tax=Sulfobacillus harzensis TaxID=2729629 RepID=A0A7Y0L1Z1_9FIRM|nr:IS66 family insertion sequence element accessory protein TnpB [Sulfobacillus harzensis]NMP21583.1 IS66 family insertion sequence element accessory protein TnpB [Sulfobacillus harzensis]